MNRKLLWAFLAIGVMLVAMPFVISMPTRANAGEEMMQNFHPIMQPDQVQTTVRYYEDVFVPLGKVAPQLNDDTVQKFQGYLKGMSELPAEAQQLMAAMAAQSGMTPAQMQAYMAEHYPSMTALLGSMPQMQRDFGALLSMMESNTDVFAQVPAGLAHYEPLVSTMEANVDNYEQVSGLPNFNLFTAFFILPGALIVLLAAFGLYRTREHVAPTTLARPTPSH